MYHYQYDRKEVERRLFAYIYHLWVQFHMRYQSYDYMLALFSILIVDMCHDYSVRRYDRHFDSDDHMDIKCHHTILCNELGHD